MNARRILVTGATGFIGGHVARRLHARGDTVIASGRDAKALDALAQAGLRTQRLDLVHDAIAPVMAGVDAIVHAAALSSPWGARQAFIAANVTATRRLLDAARHADVPRVVHLSSPSLYFRFHDRTGIDETFSPPARWITPYAESKWLAECAVHAACDARLQAVILRPRAVFGPGDRAIFPRLLARARQGTFPLVDHGRAVIDTTVIDNVVHAIECALDADLQAPVDTFNITNGEPMPVKALLDTLFSALDMQVRYRPLPRPLAMTAAGLLEGLARLRPGRPEPAISRYTLGVLAYSQTLDIGAARTRLGYTPNITVTEGIHAFARWWRQHAAP